MLVGDIAIKLSGAKCNNYRIKCVHFLLDRINFLQIKISIYGNRAFARHSDYERAYFTSIILPSRHVG